jgi:transglutaminase-like putative cysteine protease
LANSLTRAILLRTVLVAAIASTVVAVAPLSAAETADSGGVVLGEPVTSQWRIGVVVRASGNTTGILATTPVPTDWPEQKVRIVAQEISPKAKVAYRTLDGVKQMLVSIPRLAAGDEASAIVTFEITKRDMNVPESLAGFQLPKKTPRELAKYLSPSPYIESNDAKIKSLAPTLIEGQDDAWLQTEAVFDWVRENVKYEFAEAIKPAIVALKDGVGDCEELSSLFIALCRANKIPARAVWVPGHTYPEFYLEDASGRGHWFPCQAAGEAHDFGEMHEDRPILQKGDNFKVPEERTPQRYVKQFLKAANAEANPEVRFVLEKVSSESEDQ